MSDGEGPRSLPAWSVVRIDDTTAFQPGKGALRVKRVYFALYDGSESYEDFPAAGFELAKVEGAIDKAAMKLVQVLQLKGPEITVGGS